MKNTVVLKDVKSNLVEEAIIVFKENVKIKEKQLIKRCNFRLYRWMWRRKEKKFTKIKNEKFKGG